MELVRKENETKIIGARYVRYLDTRQPFGLVITDGKRWGWSLCHDKDQFSKRKAWLVAKARLAADVNWYDVLMHKLAKDLRWSFGRPSFMVEGGWKEVHTKTEAILDALVYVTSGVEGSAVIRKELEHSITNFEEEVERLR